MVLAVSRKLITPLAPAQTTATGVDAKRIALLLRYVASEDLRRAADWRSVIHSKIEELAAECSASNWDGYGARGISDAAKHAAQRFVDLLPSDLPEPEVVPDPDGKISLCWDFGKDQVFSVSVEPRILSYAGLPGMGVKRHGQEPFRGDVPKIILESVRDLLPTP